MTDIVQQLTTRANTMSRWKAAGMHFSLSVIIATTLLLLMLALWYPPPYFTLMGGATLVILIAGCDVVLGPLITLVIFKSGKKGLKLDLAIIALVQATALAYGLYTMFESRPVFTVFAVDRFEVVAANDIRDEELAKAAQPQFRDLSWTGPRVVAALPPKDLNEGIRIAMNASAGGEDIKSLPRLYVSYDAVAQDAARRAAPLGKLEKRNPRARADVVKVLDANGGERGRFGYLPVVGRFRTMSAIVDKKTGLVKGIVDAQPW